MQSVPDTRSSLIQRLPNLGDENAWQQFVEIYEPLVYRLARQKGIQHADAAEISQDVMIAVASAVERFDAKRKDGRFRDWLFIIARNTIINYLNNPRIHRLKCGGSELFQLLNTLPEPGEEESTAFDLEHRRRLFRWAAAKVRTQVQPKTWVAFWETTVEGRSVKDVADKIGIRVAAVYLAKSRVMIRIKAQVAQFQKLENLDPFQEDLSSHEAPLQ